MALKWKQGRGGATCSGVSRLYLGDGSDHSRVGQSQPVWKPLEANAADGDATGGWLVEAQQQAQRAALASAAWPDQRRHLVGRERECERVEGWLLRRLRDVSETAQGRLQQDATTRAASPPGSRSQPPRALRATQRRPPARRSCSPPRPPPLPQRAPRPRPAATAPTLGEISADLAQTSGAPRPRPAARARGRRSRHSPPREPTRWPPAHALLF